ncbi:MAG: hypothetical protein GX446_08215, partial [Chthonomonadales bacterium]|nr:hypothetical protein [Chthonomonadales bacterium]
MGIRSVSAATAAVVLLCATASSSPEPAKSKSSGVASYGSLPMAFEPNKGQADPSVAFLARGSGYAVLLRPTDATIVLTRARSRETGSKSGLWSSAKVSTSAFRMTLVGASEVAGTGVERLPGTVNHLIGNDPGKWITGIETFRSARFSQVYAGVDVVYYGTNRNLQYDFIVRPGSSPETIRLAFEGAAIKRIESGELEVAAGDAAVRFSKPVAYQETGGQRTPVAAEWNVLATKEGTPQAAFSIGDFDRTKPLIIDPLLWYSTYLGGSLNDDCLDIDLSQIGEAFVTGGTSSVDFWTLPHVFQPVFAGGNMDAFVTKFDVVGGWTMYSTYLGTQMDDIAFSIRVDRNGQAHVCGFTDSPAFPVTPGCAFPIFSGQRDAFAAILDPIGATLVYSTYIGGGGNDEAREIRLTGRGPSFAVAGGTDSQNYPVTPTAFDPTYNGSIDVTYTEILPLGQGAADLWYSTYIGAMDAEQALCMDVDPKGVAYIGGVVSSPQFPISLNPFQPWYAGNTDGFVFVLDPTVPGPAGMLYSSFIGGKDVDEVRGIVFDPFMAMCSVTGMTKSPDFPVIMGAMQLANAGGSDAFVSTIRPLNAGPLDLFVSTYIGGTADDFGNDIDVDNMEPWIVGTTRSPDFPVTAGCIQPLLNGPSDAFIVRMVPLLNFPVYSTYWGGESDEDGWGIRLDTDANAYACGTTWSQAYPTSAPIPCFDPTYNGWADGWVAKLGIGRATDTTVLPATGRIAEPVTLQAQLTYCYNNSPVIGKQMDFDIDGTYMGSAPTDSFGWATFVWIIDEGAGAGARQIRARFAGDATAGPSFGLNTLTVNLAPT